MDHKETKTKVCTRFTQHSIQRACENDSLYFNCGKEARENERYREEGKKSDVNAGFRSPYEYGLHRFEIVLGYYEYET